MPEGTNLALADEGKEELKKKYNSPDSRSTVKKQMDSDPTFGDPLSDTQMQMEADPSFGDPVGFDEAQRITSGQPSNLGMPEEKTTMEQRMEAFDSPFHNKFMEDYSEEQGAYHGTMHGRARIGAHKVFAKPALFVTRLAEHLMGKDVNDPDSYSSFLSNYISDLNKLRDRGMVKRGIGDQPDVMGVGTEIGGTIGLMAKARITDMLAGKTMTKAAPKIAKKVTELATKNPLKTQAIEGAAVAGGLGAIESQSESEEPYDFEKTKEDAKVAATLGGIAPVIVKGGAATAHGIKRAVKHPFTANPNKLFRDALNNDEKLIDRILVEMRKPDSLVPGTKLTTAQKIARNKDLAVDAPQIAALEDAAQAVSPEQLWKVKRLQMALRVKEVQKISGKSPNSLEVAKATRKKFSDPYYKLADKSTSKVPVKSVVDEVDDLLTKHSNERAIAVPLRKVKTAIEKGATVQEMASLSRGIKEMMKAETATGKAQFNNSVLSRVKATLDKQIGLVDKNYAKAQELYAKHSKPVEKIQVGQKLLSKLTDPMEITERGQQFAKAIADLKSKRAYGKPLYDALTKEQQKSMDAVLADLHANAEYVKMSTAGIKSVRDRTAAKGIGAIGAFKPILSAARSRIDEKMSLVNKKGFAELAKLMQNPKKFADMIEKGTPKQKEAMSRILHEWVTMPGVITGIKTTEGNL